jgi:hypothetical protein
MEQHPRFLRSHLLRLKCWVNAHELGAHCGDDDALCVKPLRQFGMKDHVDAGESEFADGLGILVP